MADAADPHPLNVPGPFWVDGNCIGCGLCWITARDMFRPDDERRAYVGRQPVDDVEVSSCWEALSDCPVQAVHHGNDPQHH